MNSVYVHGRSLTIKELYTRVEFPTPSDALFAALIAKYTNASMELFDDLLSLFRHSEFVSKEVTLHHTEDAFTHISERIDQIYKDLTKGRAALMGGVAYLSLEDNEV